MTRIKRNISVEKEFNGRDGFVLVDFGSRWVHFGFDVERWVFGFGIQVSPGFKTSALTILCFYVNYGWIDSWESDT